MLEFTLDVSSLAFLSGAFAWIRIFTIILIMLLAAFITLKGTNSNPIASKGETSCFLKYSFPHSFLIKSRPKIAENREIMAFTILKRPGNHEKATKTQSGKEVSNVLELI